MPEIKNSLKELYRTVPAADSRLGYLRLDMNEGVAGIPGKIAKKVLSRITPEYLSCYPEYMNLQKKIASHNRLKPENILLANGSDAAIKYIFEAFVSPGDRILITNPTFEMYPVYCRMFSCRPVVVDYLPDLSFPFRKYVENLSPKIKAAVIINPNNPTGSVVPPQVLEKIIRRSAEKDVLIIVDEAYHYFYPGTAISLVNKYENLVVLRSFSKLCGLAAARLGYMAACPRIIEGVRKVRPTYDINGLSVKLGEGILENPGTIRELVEKFKEGKRFIIRRLSEAGIEHKIGYANFILIKAEGRVEEIIRKLREEKILIGGKFKQDFLKNYIRVTIGDRETMKKFWKSFYPIWVGVSD